MESLRSKNRKPTHPGALLREDILPVVGINQTELAHKLGLSRRIVHEFLNEHRSLTADMACRLSRLVGRTPAGWLMMQQAVDLWEFEHSPTI
jgi:addiction module HigA family antidote